MATSPRLKYVVVEPTVSSLLQAEAQASSKPALERVTSPSAAQAIHLPTDSPSDAPRPVIFLDSPTTGVRVLNHEPSASPTVSPPHGSPSASPVLSSTPPTAATVPMTVLQGLPVTLTKQQRLSIMSSNRSLLDGVIDFKPFQPSGVTSGSNSARRQVETILSPELQARQEEVAKRREEAARAEKRQFVVQSTTAEPASIPPAASRAPSLVAPSSPTEPKPVQRKLPNALTSPTYDAGADIFGPKDNPTAPAGRLEVDFDTKKKDVKSKAHHRAPSADEQQHAQQPKGMREIRMRTSAIHWKFWRPPPTHPTQPPPYSAALYHLLEHNRLYLWLSIALTVFSLFAHDFVIAFLPKLLDQSCAALLLCTMVIFALEIVANSYVKENYFGRSFNFWLDLIGTFSLCFDIVWINDGIFGSSSSPTVHILAAASGLVSSSSSASSVARSASILRLTKFVRILRVIRLIRIVRVFKLQRGLKKTSTASMFQSKVGLTLSEALDKKVVGMLMLILILYPFFVVTPAEDISSRLGLEFMRQSFEVSTTTATPLVQSQIATFISYEQSSLDLFYFGMLEKASDGTISSQPRVYFDDDAASKFSNLRGSELESYVMPYYSDGSNTLIVAHYNNRPEVFLDAIYSLCFMLLVILIFTAGSLLMSHDVALLVVTPLDRMTSLVKRLAGTALLGNRPMHGHAMSTQFDNGELSRVGPSSHTASEMGSFETDAVEEVLSQLANIFQVVPSDSSETAHMPKSYAMLAGSKHTQIKTLSTVVQIDVHERPRRPGEDGDLDDLPPRAESGRLFAPGSPSYKGITAPKGANGLDDLTLGASAAEAEPTVADFPECHSIESILHHPTLLPYFRAFMTSNLSLENLLFVQEVDRYRTIMKLHVHNLFNSFISPKALNQVNISADQREAITSQLEDPSCHIFDKSQQECINLMVGCLKQFQNSKIFKGYMLKHKSRAHIAHMHHPSVPLATPTLTAASGNNSARPHNVRSKSQLPPQYHRASPQVGASISSSIISIAPPTLHLHEPSRGRTDSNASLPHPPSNASVDNLSPIHRQQPQPPASNRRKMTTIGLTVDAAAASAAAEASYSNSPVHGNELTLPGSIPVTPTTGQPSARSSSVDLRAQSMPHTVDTIELRPTTLRGQSDPHHLSSTAAPLPSMLRALSPSRVGGSSEPLADGVLITAPRPLSSLEAPTSLPLPVENGTGTFSLRLAATTSKRASLEAPSDHTTSRGHTTPARKPATTFASTGAAMMAR